MCPVTPGGVGRTRGWLRAPAEVTPWGATVPNWAVGLFLAGLVGLVDLFWFLMPGWASRETYDDYQLAVPLPSVLYLLLGNRRLHRRWPPAS